VAWGGARKRTIRADVWVGDRRGIVIRLDRVVISVALICVFC